LKFPLQLSQILQDELVGFIGAASSGQIQFPLHSENYICDHTVKVQCRCGTGARISVVSFSAKSTARLAWQLIGDDHGCPDADLAGTRARVWIAELWVTQDLFDDGRVFDEADEWEESSP